MKIIFIFVIGSKPNLIAYFILPSA